MPPSSYLTWICYPRSKEREMFKVIGGVVVYGFALLGLAVPDSGLL